MNHIPRIRFSLPLCIAGLLGGCMDSSISGDEYGSDNYPGTERHSGMAVSGWVDAATDSLSSFAADVDEGSYTWTRRMLQERGVVDPAAIRPEEFINYFHQDYRNPQQGTFGVELEGGPSLWRGDSLHVLRVGIQGKVDSAAILAPWNLTFLIDVSGSMGTRMEFVKNILGVLVDNMRPSDILSIAAYDQSPRVLLEPVTLAESNKAAIKAVINGLRADGSTNMADGMRVGYQLNDKRRIQGGNNRVVVVSDGDANVGNTDANGILTLIKEHTDAGTTITTLGVGSGNYNAEMMESLADRGNGNYFYLDSQREAERVLAWKIGSTMTLIARDLKIQVAFDPRRVSRYRLIGFENRAIADSDFKKDSTDGGEIGSGHRVTALYELVLKQGDLPLGEVRLRYKEPNRSTETPVTLTIDPAVMRASVAEVSPRMKFTQCVAEFAERLRRSPFVNTEYPRILEKASAFHDPSDSADVEFLRLVPLVR